MNSSDDLKFIIRGLKLSLKRLTQRSIDSAKIGDFYACALIDQEIRFLDETVQILEGWQQLLQLHDLGVQPLDCPERYIDRARWARQKSRERLAHMRKKLRKSGGVPEIGNDTDWVESMKSLALIG